MSGFSEPLNELTFMPETQLGCLAFIGLYSMTVSIVFYPLSVIDIPIRLCELALSVHLPIFPLTYISVTICPSHFSIPVLIAVLNLPFVFTTWKGNFSDPLLFIQFFLHVCCVEMMFYLRFMTFFNGLHTFRFYHLFINHFLLIFRL